MCQQLIYKYFLLTPAELEIWDSDPEMFGNWLTIIYSYLLKLIN